MVAEAIEGVSLRKVAKESGLSIGSVRHYFDGHHDLLTAAAQEAGARMGRRLASHPAQGLRGLTSDAALNCLDVPAPDLATAQLTAVIGGLTLDTVTPHGALSIERLQTVPRATSEGIDGAPCLPG